MTDRLFVPLKSAPFEWLQSGRKDTELRGLNSRFNTETVVPGRPVQFVKGYNPVNGEIWGVIEHVQTFRAGTYNDKAIILPDGYDFQRINPTVDTEEEFQKSVREMLGGYDNYIAFRNRLLDDPP